MGDQMERAIANESVPCFREYKLNSLQLSLCNDTKPTASSGETGEGQTEAHLAAARVTSGRNVAR